jgi:hypothetical protein
MNGSASNYVSACRELESYQPKRTTAEEVEDFYKTIRRYGSIDFIGGKLIIHFERDSIIKERFMLHGRWWIGTFNLGKYTATVDLPNAGVTFANQETFAKVLRIHPHVGSSGNPCFGTGTQEMVDLLKSQDIKMIVKMCFVFLTKYSESSPFSHLAEYLLLCEERYLEEEGESSKLVGNDAKDKDQH